MVTLFEQLNGKAVGVLHTFLDCLKDRRRRLENVDKAMYEHALLNNCSTDIRDYVEINKSQFKDFEIRKMVFAIELSTGIVRVSYGAIVRNAWDAYEPNGLSYRFTTHRKVDWKSPHVFFATDLKNPEKSIPVTLSASWLRDFERQVGPLRNILPDTNDSSIDRYAGLWQLKKGMKPSDYNQMSMFCSVLGLSLYGNPEQTLPKALQEFSSMKSRLVEAILRKVEKDFPESEWESSPLAEIYPYMTNFVRLLLKL
jgi:hypothetical protein